MAKSELELEFEHYVTIGRDMPKQAPDIMLIAYGFYKQATEGDNSATRPTENSDIVRTFMHDQWDRLKGMPISEAMEQYILFIKTLEQQQAETAKNN